MTTTPLIPDAVAGPRALVRSDRSGPIGRWVLHRAGVLNVWQYDRVELRLGGGRLLLRGKNGAGKSKALEILLPFLLDGDTRRLDATGRDRTTITWLMTDGRAAGNHVGYVWLELRCDDDGGGERFLTLGAGLKASTATRRGDAWFFITDQRVGVDVELDRAGECLSVERLKELLGEEAVTHSGAEHRRRVGRQVFGLFDDARYANLLHLLHRLRDPNIGNRVEAGELASVLSEALPPIDDTVLVDAASRFDDLEAIRDQVERAQRTAAALGRFLDTYRGYTRTVLRRRARALLSADAARAAASRQVRQAERGVAEAEQAVLDADDAVERHLTERQAAEDDRRALERSEAYRAHQDLVDRQERVDALGSAADAAERAAARASDAVTRATGELTAAEQSTRGALAEAATTGREVAARTVPAGLDRGLAGPIPAPAADGSLAAGDLAAAADRARRARTVVEARQRRAGEVRVVAVRAERAAHDAAAKDERAAESETLVEREREVVATARAGRDAAERSWADDVRSWSAAGVAASCGADWTPVAILLDDRGGRAEWVVDVRGAVGAAIEPVLASARSTAAAAAVDVAAASSGRDEAAARLAELEATTEARPAPGRYREAERDPAAGAPLYELVDVRPGVSALAAAGIEAALAASGMLDAWVAADGVVVHPRTHDTILRADTARRPSASLSEILVPAAAGAAVSAATVADVLASIGLGEHDDVPAWVTDDGRWSLGALRGAWSKPTVEFLGAGARQLTRERRLAELRAALAEAEAARRAAVAAAESADAFRDQLETLPASLPAADNVVRTGHDLVAAERTLATARARHDDDRRRAEVARALASRATAELADEAGRDGLPTGVDELDAVLHALGELRQALGEHRRALDALVGHHDRWVARRAELTERAREATDAETEARGRRAAHGSAAHELASLRDALETSVTAVLTELATIERRLGELQRLLPAAQRHRDEAISGRSTAAARLDHARQAEELVATQLADAVAAVTGALELPGVVLAATEDDHLLEAATDDPVTMAGNMLRLVDGDDDVADSTVLARYDRLNQELAGGYDTAIEELDGVKVVHVDDDSGRQPLAAVARRLAEEAVAAQSRLAAREREVLERFLLRELADEVRAKLLDAHDLVHGTNRTLAGVRTSHGKGAHLDWTLRDDAAAPAATAARLLVDDLRGDDGDARLRDALLALIDAERASDPTASYEQHLRAALDYRSWHRFAVRVTDTAAPGSARVLSSRLGLSQGEQRVLSYLALFAAAAAQFDAIGRSAPTAPRLLLLDDAFAKVDEPTHGRLLGLLVDLRLDFVVTSERLWGCFPSVPSLEIYEAIRDPAEVGVALVHFRWDGRQRTLVGV
jgi:uncharacterized protein (TIGR02680 family)